MPLNPALIAATAADLLACSCSALVASHRMDASCCDSESDGFRAFLSAGQPGTEACGCDCGVLAVSLARLFESDEPPFQAVGPARCGHRQAIAEFTIERHVCVTDEGEVIRPPATLTANATKLWTDLWVLWTGVECCFRAWEADHQEARQGWLVDSRPSEPLGGCAGMVMTVQVVLGPSCDCRPYTPEPIA